MGGKGSPYEITERNPQRNNKTPQSPTVTMDGEQQQHPPTTVVTTRPIPTSPTSPQKSRSSTTNVMSVAQSSKDDTGAAKSGGMSGLLAERMAEGGGALCNDENGLCLGSKGDIDTSQSGVYTAIAKLACQLDSTVDGGSGGNRREVPLVSIQTEKAALLVKEYGGRTVVFRVPAEANKIEAAVGDGETTNDEGQSSTEAKAS